jgi:hypothetical protein
MALTRRVIDTRLVAWGKGLLSRAGMSVAVDGTNADLNEPLAMALEYFNLDPADPTAVWDADLANVTPQLQAQFTDLARIELAEVVLNRLLVLPKSQQWGGDGGTDYRVDFQNLVTDLKSTIDALWDRYLKEYEQSGAPAIGHMERQIRHDFDTRRYYPGGNFQ